MVMTENFDPVTGEIVEPPIAQPVREKKPARKNGKARVPADESKRDKFVRLVDPRVNRAILAIRRIARLGGANAGHYDFDEEDIGKIVQVLSKEIVAMEKTMIRGKPEAPAFSIID
jgi:hypothetical protein